MIDRDNEPLVGRGRLTVSSSDSEGDQFQVQSVCRASTGAEDTGRVAQPATPVRHVVKRLRLASRHEGRMSQACTVTAPSEDLAESALSCGDLDAFPALPGTMIDPESASAPQDAQLPSDGEDELPVWSLAKRSGHHGVEQEDFKVRTQNRFEPSVPQEIRNVKHRVECELDWQDHKPELLEAFDLMRACFAEVGFGE